MRVKLFFIIAILLISFVVAGSIITQKEAEGIVDKTKIIPNYYNISSIKNISKVYTTPILNYSIIYFKCNGKESQMKADSNTSLNKLSYYFEYAVPYYCNGTYSKVFDWKGNQLMEINATFMGGRIIKSFNSTEINRIKCLNSGVCK